MGLGASLAVGPVAVTGAPERLLEGLYYEEDRTTEVNMVFSFMHLYCFIFAAR